jgi:hypothetical protein
MSTPLAHLDEATFGSLDLSERARLLHVATCAVCRRRTATELLRDPSLLDPLADAAAARLRKQLERTDLTTKALAIDRERREATELVRELRAQPGSWGTAAADPRHGSPEVVWQLLEAAKQEEPLVALRLINLAGEIAVQLASHPARGSLYPQLCLEVRCARANSLLDLANHREAARELRSTRKLLSSDLGYGRALYCRTLGRLRTEEQRWEEAVALFGRAVALFEEHGGAAEVGQALIEQGSALIETGDADEAAGVIAAGLYEGGEVQPLAVTGRLALAVALSELHESAAAGKLLAEADTILAQVQEVPLRLRLRWLAALSKRRCGHRSSAFRQLLGVLNAFIALGSDYEAARVLLETLTLCHTSRWRRILARRDLRRAIEKLSVSPYLHQRLRAVTRFAVYAVEQPTSLTPEVLITTARYLLESRYQPERPFHPTHSGLLVTLDWDELEPATRCDLCAEVGAASELAELPARELSVALQEQISWRYELLRRVRIHFKAAAPESPPT